MKFYTFCFLFFYKMLLVMVVIDSCRSLNGIKLIYFELSPDKIRLACILFDCPPKPAFKQAFNKHKIIPFS